MSDLVTFYRSAGFTDDEIGAHFAAKRDTLRAGGFSDDEIDDYFGIPQLPKDIPQPLLDRMSREKTFADKVGKWLKSDSIAQSFIAGWGEEPFGRKMFESEADIDFATSNPALASVAGAMSMPIEAVARGTAGLIHMGHDGIAQIFGEQFANEMAGMAEWAMTRGDILAKTGGRPLPRAEDFSNAGRVLGNGDTTPIMEGKLVDLYEKGIHPAEVATDAQADPTIRQSIVSLDKADMPAAYGVAEDILTERAPQSAGAAAAPQPSYSAAEQQILSKISIDEQSRTSKMTLDRLYTNFLDRLFPISKAVKEADLPDLKPEDNPYVLARLLSGHVGKADHFLNNATFDFNTYEANGPSLKSILNPVRGDLNGFRAYAAAARAIELEDRGIRSGFVEEGPSAPPLVSSGLDAARTVVVEGRERFEKPFRDLIAYQNRVAAYLRDSGVLSKAGYDAMVEANKMYVPFTRVMGIDEGAQAGGGSTLQAKNPIKAIKGSARSIVDPIESVVRNTYHMVEMAEKNQVGTKLVDMLKRASDELPEVPRAVETVKTEANPRAAAMSEALGEVGIKKPTDLADALAHASEDRKPDEIAILRDGKRETYKVDPDLARAMKGLDAESAHFLFKILAAPANTLRAGAVSTPEFWGRHIMRDFLYATTTFKGGIFHPVDMAKGVLGLIVKDADYWNWLKGGGGGNTVVALDRQYMQDDLRKLTGQTGLFGRAWNVVTSPDASMWERTGAVGKLPFQAISKFVLNPLRVMTEFAENASHLAAFKKTFPTIDPVAPANLREQVIRSAWASRDTAVDAARMGASMRTWNLIEAFANIKLQDTDRVVRAIKDNPVPTITKMAAAITVPSVVLWAINHDDPRYAEIPQWQKDIYWIIPMGSAPPSPLHQMQAAQRGVAPTNSAKFFLRVPKPWAMGMIFGTLPERLLEKYKAENPEAFKEFFKSLWETIGPTFVPNAAAPIIDHFANRSTFMNRTLIPADQEKHLPEYQYTPYTTELTKALGKTIGALPGMSQLKLENSGFGGIGRALTSPILIENYVRGWTGTLGMYALQAADKGLRAAGQIPDPPQPASTLADIPVIRAFVIRYPSASAESIQNFYDEYEKNKKFFDTWNAMAKDGNVAAMQHIREMGGDMMFVQLDGIKQTLSEHSQLIRDIYKNESIPADEKRQKIDELYFNMITISRFGVAAVHRMREEAADVVTRPTRAIPLH